MDRDSLHFIGRLGKTWGHLGELNVHLEDVQPDEIEDHGSVFVDIEGQMVPFFFTGIREKGREGVLIKFDDLDDPQASAILVGRDIYLPPGVLSDGSDESWDPDELVGLLVIDREHGELGEVTGMEGTDKNPVLVIQRGAQEVMVPMVDELIDDLDAEKGILYVRTPPGLVEMYREG